MSAPRKPRNAPRGFNEMRLLANEAARAHRATLFLDSGVLCSRRIRKWPLIFKAVEKEGLYEGESTFQLGSDKARSAQARFLIAPRLKPGLRLSPHPASHLRSFSVIHCHHEALLPISSAY